MQETADGIAELRAARAARSAAWSSTRSARATSTTTTWPRSAPARSTATRGRRRPDRAGLDGRPATLVAGLLAEARDHAERRALEDAQRERGRRRSTCPTYELPRLPGGIDLGGALRAGRDCCATRGWHEPPHDAPRPRRPAGRPAAPTGGRALDVDALLDDRAHRHHRVLRLGRRRQDHDVGGARAAGGRARPQGRGAHHRPGPAAGPVDGHRGSSTTPRGRSPGVGAGRAAAALDAMMLDMKRTFDEVVESQASPEKAKQILENPFYVALSSSFAGTQEYMAMEKLGQIHADAQRDGTYDLIVVDTPPSRSALDFLDAPERLSSFLDGRFIRLLLAPAKGPARLMTAGFGAGHQRADQGPRRPGAARHADLRGRLRHALRRLPAARPEDLRAAPGRRDGVPRRRRARSRTRCARRRTSSSGSARTTCRWPGWSSTGPARSRTGDAVGRRGDGGGRSGCGEDDPDVADGRAAAAARRPGPDGRARGAAARAASRRRTRRCRRRSCRPWRATCTTSTACVRSATLLAGSGRPDGRCPTVGCRRQRGSGADDHTDVLLAGRLEDGAPRCVRTAAQQRTALALGHPAPDAPLDLVVESLGEALGAHRARTARPAWPCSAPHHGRTARRAVTPGTQPGQPSLDST